MKMDAYGRPPLTHTDAFLDIRYLYIAFVAGTDIPQQLIQ
jgi:hypothetical protein